MLKHVGRHGESKVVIAYNEVPNEDHMALVIYTERLPDALHDSLMTVVEGQTGQSEKVLAEALHRSVTNDGTNLLQALHQGGWLKKVQTKQVILTPNAKTTVRLDELNKILHQMEQGDEAIQKMRELDEGRGFRDPQRTQTRDVGEPAVAQQTALSDADIAKDLLSQAEGMKAQIKVLTEEAARLEAEANSLMPRKATITKPKAKNVGKPATKKAKAKA